MTYEIAPTFRVGQTVRLTRDILRITSKYAMTYHKGQHGKIVQVPDAESGLGQYAIELGAEIAPNLRRVYWEGDAPEQHRFEDDVEIVPDEPAKRTPPPMPVGEVIGYEGLPDTLVAYLRALEEARFNLAVAGRERTINKRLEELQDARKALTEVLLADDRSRALGDEDDDGPTCEGCGMAGPDECEPCFVVYENGRNEELMYCDECITTAQGGIRAGEGDGRVVVVRLKWVKMLRGVLTRFFRVVPPGGNGGEEDRFTLFGASGKIDDNNNLVVDPSTEYRVTRWPFGAVELDELAHVTGFTFTAEDFDNAR